VTFRQPANGTVSPPLEGVAGELAANATRVIRLAAANTPRSLQPQIGPSELGTPCTRRLGYRLLDWPQPSAGSDPWAAVIGTATHTWLAAAFTWENTQLAWDRYLIETEVHLPGGITGHCDLYDRYSRTVADWKITGKVADYRRAGPGEQYRIQAQCYGLGLQLAGEKPEHVAVVFFPRGGRIDGMHVWAEPYDPGVAVAAIRRYQTVCDFHAHVDPESHPERWGWLPSADAYCTYCPWYLPGSTDLAAGCPGHGK